MHNIISESMSDEYQAAAVLVVGGPGKPNPVLAHVELGVVRTWTHNIYIYIYNSISISAGTKFPACIVTGRPLMDQRAVWSCGTCHHRAHEQDVTMRQNCPLCHTAINVQ